jgi:hypothetical protein
MAQFHNAAVQRVYSALVLRDDTVYDNAKGSMQSVSKVLTDVLTVSNRLGKAPEQRAELAKIYGEFSELQKNVLQNLPLIAVPTRKFIQLQFRIAQEGSTEFSISRAAKIREDFDKIEDKTLSLYSSNLSIAVSSAVETIIKTAAVGGVYLETLFNEVKTAKAAVAAASIAWNAELAVNCKVTADKHYCELQQKFADLQVLLAFSPVFIYH